MRALKILALCMAGAFVCAFAFAITLHFSLPPSDLAYGGSAWHFISDPFTFVGALIALAAALLICRFSGWRIFAPRL